MPDSDSHHDAATYSDDVDYEGLTDPAVAIRGVRWARDPSTSRALLEAVINATPDAIYIKDLDGRYQFFNDGAELVVGKSAAQVLGMTDTFIFPADEAEAVRVGDRAVIEGGVPITYDEEVTASNGELVHFESTKGPLFDEEGAPIGLFGFARDVTERYVAQEEARSHATRLGLLAEASRLFAEAGDDYQSVLDRVARYVCEALADSCVLRLIRHDRSRLDLSALHTIEPELSDVLRGLAGTSLEIATSTGSVAQVHLNAEPIFLPVIDDEMRQATYPPDAWPLLERFPMHSVIVVPLRAQGDGIGVLSLYRYRSEWPAFCESDLLLAEDLADRAAMAIANARLLLQAQAELTEKARITQELLDGNIRLAAMASSIIGTLSRVVEARDPYTQGHEERVAALSRLLAEELGLSYDETEGIEVSARVHDIGKLRVPAEILTKPGALDSVEFALVKGHSEAGRGILEGIPFPWPVAEIVVQHHERMDGSGYPNGLRGDEILLAARIIGVADVVEAMSSFRPYRPARGLDMAMAEVSAGSGIKFDADVVAACERLYVAGRMPF